MIAQTTAQQRQAAIDALTECRRCMKQRTTRRPLNHDGYCPKCTAEFAAYPPTFGDAMASTVEETDGDPLTSEQCEALDALAIAANEKRDAQRVELTYAPNWSLEDKVACRDAITAADRKCLIASMRVLDLGIDDNVRLYAKSECGYADRFDALNENAWNEITRQSQWVEGVSVISGGSHEENEPACPSCHGEHGRRVSTGGGLSDWVWVPCRDCQNQPLTAAVPPISGGSHGAVETRQEAPGATLNRRVMEMTPEQVELLDQLAYSAYELRWVRSLLQTDRSWAMKESVISAMKAVEGATASCVAAGIADDALLTFAKSKSGYEHRMNCDLPWSVPAPDSEPMVSRAVTQALETYYGTCEWMRGDPAWSPQDGEEFYSQFNALYQNASKETKRALLSLESSVTAAIDTAIERGVRYGAMLASRASRAG